MDWEHRDDSRTLAASSGFAPSSPAPPFALPLDPATLPAPISPALKLFVVRAAIDTAVHLDQNITSDNNADSALHDLPSNSGYAAVGGLARQV